MAIRFKCPKCGAELNVKDELAGKQGRCPACKNAVTVPRLAPARRKVEEVVEAEVVEEVEEIDEVEYVDEDEPPRRPVGIKRRRDIEDEDDRPRRSRRRDEDEEDEEPRGRRRRGRRDDEEEEDDRPSRRSSSRRRREEDDYEDDYGDEDDYEDDPERRKKARAKKKRRAWKTARTGVFLNFISMCIYTGADGVFLLIYLLGLITSSSRSTGIAGLLSILLYLVLGLTVVSWILFIVGSGFMIVAPGKNGEKGLAITSLTLGAVTVLFFLYIYFTIEMVPTALFSGAGVRGALLIILFFPLVEFARLTIFAIFQWAVGKSTRDDGLASSSLLLAILIPSAGCGSMLFTWLLTLIVKSQAMLYVFFFLVFVEFAAGVGLMAWFTLNTSNAKRAIDDVI